MKKILTGFLIFLSFGIFSVSADETVENGENIEESINPYEGITDYIIVKDKEDEDLEKGENKFYNSFDYVESGIQIGKIFYKFTNEKGEVVLFSRQGKYCNLATGRCKNFNNEGLGDYGLKIIEHKDYIIFQNQLGYTSSWGGGSGNYGNYLYIYSKKYDGFLTLNLNLRLYYKGIPGFSDFDSLPEFQSLSQSNKNIYNQKKEQNYSYIKLFNSSSSPKNSISFNGETLIFNIGLSQNINQLVFLHISNIPENFFNNGMYLTSVKLKNFDITNLSNIDGFIYNYRGDFNLSDKFTKHNSGYNLDRLRKGEITEEIYRKYKGLKNENLDFYFNSENDYRLSEKIPGIDLSIYGQYEYPHENFENWYNEGNGNINIGYNKIGYFFDGAFIYQNSQNILKMAYNIDDEGDYRNITIRELLRSDIFSFLWNKFHDVKLVSMGYLNNEKSYYISLMLKPAVGNWYFDTFQFKGFDFFKTKEIIRTHRLYTLGKVNDMYLRLDETFFKKGYSYSTSSGFFYENKSDTINLDFPGAPFFVSKYGNNLYFYLITKNNYILRATDPLIYNGEIGNNNFKFPTIDIGINPKNKKGNKLTEDGNGNYETIVNDKSDKDGNIILEKFRSVVNEIYNFIKPIIDLLFFDGLKNYNTTVDIPFFDVKIINGKPGFGFGLYEATLPDKEKYIIKGVNLMSSDSSSGGKNFITFLLGICYIVGKFFIVSLFLVPFVILYYFVKFIVSNLTMRKGDIEGSDTIVGKGVGVFYQLSIASIFGTFYYLFYLNILGPISIAIDWLNYIFHFIITSFFNWDFFVIFVNGFFGAFYSILIWYTIYFFYKNN